MAVEVWFRNPIFYINECEELNQWNFVFDQGFLMNQDCNIDRWLALNVDPSVNYRVMVTSSNGAMSYANRAIEIRPGFTHDEPSAVYPLWSHELGTLDDLEKMMRYSPGQDAAACSNTNRIQNQRPVLGQEHRVVIVAPKSNSPEGKKLIRILSEMQTEYPDCTLHLHGSYGFGVMFGHDFKSVDVEPRELARGGKIITGGGFDGLWENVYERFPLWVKASEYTAADLAVPRYRCMFNMKSALWAAQYFKQNVKFKVHARPGMVFDPMDPYGSLDTATDHRPPYQGDPQPGDMLACDRCSLSSSCKFYRVDAVCSLPKSEGEELVGRFRTRDSSQIIDALGDMLDRQQARAERGIEQEIQDEKLDPEVTKIINGVIDRGVKLALLVDPALHPKTGVVVNTQINNGGVHALGTGNMQELAGRAVAQLEAAGYARSEISMEMIQAVINGQPVPPKAIEAHLAP